MKTIFPVFLVAILLSSCAMPDHSKMKATRLVRELEFVYQWDPLTGADRSGAFQGLVSLGEDAYEALARTILDKRPTRIMDRHPRQIPVVGDIAFLILIRISEVDPKMFEKEGLKVNERESPAFSLTFSPGARKRVRDRILKEWCDLEP